MSAVTQIRVRYKDTDTMSVVYYGNYQRDHARRRSRRSVVTAVASLMGGRSSPVCYTNFRLRDQAARMIRDS
jgi:hypothetical protein